MNIFYATHFIKDYIKQISDSDLTDILCDYKIHVMRLNEHINFIEKEIQVRKDNGITVKEITYKGGT